jgi:hypothetical protein
VISIKVVYKALRYYFSFNVWEVLEDHAFPKPVRDNYVIRRPITKGEAGNKVY